MKITVRQLKQLVREAVEDRGADPNGWWNLFPELCTVLERAETLAHAVVDSIDSDQELDAEKRTPASDSATAVRESVRDALDSVRELGDLLGGGVG